MFCSCANVIDTADPNTSICPICTGQPGALPALNAMAIDLGVKTSLALQCTIPNRSIFDRKNYFYPDLPKGYQISQFQFPLAVDGKIEFDIVGEKPPRDHITVGITRAHLEEDAAKNIHTSSDDNNTQATYVDYNRAGTPLLEIVSEPDLRSPAEAKTYLQEIRAILRAIGASDADMEKGQMRCDANVSLLPVDAQNLPLQRKYNPKIEVKNLNSFRSVERAIAYEIKRHTKLYESNIIPVESTRGWDENKGETFEQRLKETSADYRYFPEPDLPPQNLIQIHECMKATLPELPANQRRRLINEYWFSPSDAAFFVANGWTSYVEDVMSELGGWLEATNPTGKSGGELLDDQKKKFAKLSGGWMTSKLTNILTDRNMTITDLKLKAEDFAEFIHLIDAGEINSANAMKLLVYLVDTGDDPSHLMEIHNLGQNLPKDELKQIVKDIIINSPDQAAQVKAGKLGVLKWFVGAVMKATEGKANPVTTEELVKKEFEDTN